MAFEGNAPCPSPEGTWSRETKLFVYRTLTVQGLTEGQFPLDWRFYFTRLLRLAGLDDSRWHGTYTPFRRMFATLYMRRYDMSEAPALQHQLVHWSPSQTVHYHTDKVARPPGLAVTDLYPIYNPSTDTKSIQQSIKEASQEYLVDLLKDLFEGRSTSGVFPRLILKLTRRLSAKADFRKLNLERKAKKVAAVLNDRGYQLTPLPHTICAADTPRHTAKVAMCFRDGFLHREDASPSSCSGCIHSICNDSYLTNIREEIARCERIAAHPGNPLALRAAMQRAAKQLTEIVLYEQELSRGTTLIAAELSRAWSDHVYQEAADA
jgi:hypothetical protein